MKKSIYMYLGMFMIFIAVLGVTLAVFTDRSKILGSTFSVGSADLKLLLDVSLGLDPENLVDDFEGPSFSNVSPNWQYDYPMKLYNNGTTDVALTSNANYATTNDPHELRQIIFVQPIIWDDINSNGVVDEGELGSSLDRKTIVKWKSEGYNFGVLSPGSVQGVVLRFSTDAVPTSRQGTSGIFDFEFNSVGME